MFVNGRAVKEGKKSKEWRKAYMGMYMRELEIREEGRAEGHAEGHAEGRAEGHAEGRAEILKKMIIRDMPGDLIMSLGYTAEEIEAVKESLLQKA